MKLQRLSGGVKAKMISSAEGSTIWWSKVVVSIK